MSRYTDELTREEIDYLLHQTKPGHFHGDWLWLVVHCENIGHALVEVFRIKDIVSELEALVKKYG